MLNTDPEALSEGINRFVNWLIENFSGVFDAISVALLNILLVADNLFRTSPWVLLIFVAALTPGSLIGWTRRTLIFGSVPIVVGLVIGITGIMSAVPSSIQWLALPLAVGSGAWLITRQYALPIGLCFALFAVRWLGLWDLAMQSLALTLAALTVSVLFGLPLGLAAGVSDRFRTALRPVLDLMQTMPSFVYLIPALMLFGLGKVPALLATLIYAAPPLIRLTDHGIRSASPAAVEAAIAFGATRWQRLTKVELPLAIPAILQGLNQTTMLALSMVVIASMIGARGLGEEVLLGIQRLDVGRGVLAGTAIVLLAIVLDRLTQAIGRATQVNEAQTR